MLNLKGFVATKVGFLVVWRELVATKVGFLLSGESRLRRNSSFYQVARAGDWLILFPVLIEVMQTLY